MPVLRTRVGFAPTRPLPVGVTTRMASPPRRPGSSLRSKPAGTTRVACVPTALWPVGVTTITASPPHPAGNSPKSPSAAGIRAGAWPTDPSRAEAAARLVKRTYRLGNSALSPPRSRPHAAIAWPVQRHRRRRQPRLRCAHGQHHHLCRRMGGRWTVRCARRTIHCRSWGLAPFVWSAHEWHHRLLGQG